MERPSQTAFTSKTFHCAIVQHDGKNMPGLEQRRFRRDIDGVGQHGLLLVAWMEKHEKWNSTAVAAATTKSRQNCSQSKSNIRVGICCGVVCNRPHIKHTFLK